MLNQEVMDKLLGCSNFGAIDVFAVDVLEGEPGFRKNNADKQK